MLIILNKTKTIALKGNVKDQNCIIIDDIIDTGNTVCSAALALRENGAKKISAYITHAVLSKGALTNIKNSVLDELVVTDTIDFQKKYQTNLISGTHSEDFNKIRG